MITYQSVIDLLKEYPNWSIFPVILSQGEAKVDKKPAIPWKEFMERRPTDAELHAWFDEPKYNAIGLATGKISGVVVVDLDTDQIPEGINLASPLVAKTISGGRHFYYQWDEEMRNDAKIEGLPVDFRGDGGFVVIPPSALGEKSYSWENGTCPEFLLEVLPQELKDLLKGRKGQSLPFVALPNDPGLTIPHKVAYGDGIEEFMSPTALGERNVRTAEYAGKILARLAPSDWEVFGWGELVRWNNTNSPPLAERELRTTWQSVQAIELRKREVEFNSSRLVEKDGSKPEEAYKDKESDSNICSIFRGHEATDEYGRLEAKYGVGLTTGYDELDYFFKFLPEQLYMISAQTHVGKSTFALNMCARVASLNTDVLFCSLEQGIFIEPRVRSMLGRSFPEHLALLTSDKMLTVDQLVQVIEQTKVRPQLICVDHIHFLKKNGRGATEDIDEIVLGLQNMAKKLSVPIIVISHVRKLNSQKIPQMDDLKDSSSLSQVPSVVIVITRDKNTGGNAYDSLLSNEGKIYIAKNRIQGKTGERAFTLENSGNIIIKSKEESLKIRKADNLDDDEVKTLFT